MAEAASTEGPLRRGRLLVIDDEQKIGRMLELALAASGHFVETTDDAEHGLQRLREHPFDIVLTDLRMPRVDGLEVLQRAKVIRPGCEVILMTAFATVDTARWALKRGAVDYLEKPFSIRHELVPLVQSILASGDDDERAQAAGRASQGKTEPAGHEAQNTAEHSDGLVGQSAPVLDLRELVRKVAPSNAAVLLRGESGSGKEVVANTLHTLSRRADEPFVKINCAALPDALLESELFGHVKGAFTGADSARDGLFQVANGGTLLLDEIGEVSTSFQPKLLRVLQEGEFHRVGDSGKPIRVDVRIIAATNRDLTAAVECGQFRADLYYRLNVVPVAVPPLRERLDDLPALVAHFIARATKHDHKRFDAEAMEAMNRYPWPGNVRELANAVEYALVLSEAAEMGVTDLPVAIQDHERLSQEVADQAPAGTLDEIETRCILQAMEKSRFNRTRAAQLLGISRRTLGYRIQKYALDEALGRLRERTPKGDPRASKAGAPASGRRGR